MLKSFVKSLNANIYLNAALEIGADIEIVDEDINYAIIKYKGQELIVVGTVLGVNNAATRKISVSKIYTSMLLKKHFSDLISDFIYIYPPFDEKKDIEKIKVFWKNSNKKIVIKPSMGSLAKGVLVNPVNMDEIVDHIKYLLKGVKSNSIIIEKFIDAKYEYRIIVVKGIVIDVIERIPANVVGDGVSTLQELIDKKNEEKSRNGLSLIDLDINYIQSKKISLSTIIKRGEQIFLNKVCNLAKGGDIKKVDINKVNPRLANIFNEIHKITRLNLIGFDIMTNDLSKEPIEAGTFINEINSAPMPNLSYYTSINDDDPLANVKILLKTIFFNRRNDRLSLI